MSDYTTPSLTSSIALVTAREVTMRLRSKAFLISTGLLLLAVLASILIGSLVSANGSTPKVAAVGGAIQTVQADRGLTYVATDSQAEAEKMLKAGDIDAIILDSGVTPANPTGLTVVGNDSVPNDVVGVLSQTPHVELLDPNAPNPLLTYFVALGFGLVFFMSGITFGSTIAQSVVEEKQTRVVELLLSSIPVRALMAGKVLGNSILAIGQILAIAILAVVALTITGQRVTVSALGPSIIWFVVFFVFGFIMLAALFAAAASLVSRSEDVGSVTSPVTLLVMIPYLLVITMGSNPTVLTIMSYVPFSAPVGMPMRIFLGQAQWWEPLLSLVILLASTAVVLWIGERIYAGSLLKMGGRVKIREALSR